MKRTALHDRHVARGAKMVDFGGWEMPLQYVGVLHEHHVVREKVGVFDVSHMGCVAVEGPEAEAFLDYVSTNVIAGKKDMTACYTVWANEVGASIDDGIVFRFHTNKFFVVVNASNRNKDLEHFRKYAQDFDVTLTDRYESEGILAVQGPLSEKLLTEVLGALPELKFMRFAELTFKGSTIILSKTGYTGSPGYEIYADNSVLPAVWDALFASKEDYGLESIGLGARDTLRLEMGFALYGHELTDNIAPTESVSAWTVKLNKDKFLGKTALQALEEAPNKRRQYGVVLLDKGIPRQGCVVRKDKRDIGVVTSGNLSPTLGKGIALIMTSEALHDDDNITITIRNKHIPAAVKPLPFVTL